MKKLLILIFSFLGIASCGGGSQTPTILFGIDGAEWQVINEMIGNGELPNLARIKNEGAWGHLINNGMENSPVVWTTFATGHFARDHGILDHVFPFGGEGARRPVTSELRQEPALWNIATHYDLSSTVIGYFVSHPPEPVNGTIVSFQAPAWREGSIYPEDALALEEWRYQRLLDPVEQRREWGPYFGWDYDSEQAGDPDSPFQVPAATILERHLEKLILRDEFLRVATRDLARDPTDLFITYYRVPDILSHSLWRYYDPSVFGKKPSETELELFGESVRESYRFVDRALGELLGAFEGNANLIIVSDHGFGRAAQQLMEDENAPVKYLSGDHRADGVVMAMGPDIEPGQIEGLTIMEIAPTLAALMNVPVAGNLPGEVAMDLIRPEFFERHPLKSVADYSHVAMPHREFELDHDVQEEEMQQLKGLGYVGEGVEFDVSTESGEYDFWSYDSRAVAGHMASEVIYYLLRGDRDQAQRAYELVKTHRPELDYRILMILEHKLGSFKERLPEGVVDEERFREFIDTNLSARARSLGLESNQ